MSASESIEVLISDLLEWPGPERRDYYEAPWGATQRGGGGGSQLIR
jgi:hypothetical protein